MSFAVGSLVRARGRDWVVLPGSEEDFLLLRPLAGADDEIAGIHPAVEEIAPATFPPPDLRRLGDHRSCRLLRDAARISTREGAGPFRSFSRIAVEPRPYQLVPLLMALRLDPVRLLIADDVGIGKTVEAALIARELLDRGEIERIAVLCPPHLAEQWQAELEEKFHIGAELVLPGTAARLERHCRPGESLFERYRHVIVSLDFIKSDQRRHEFLRTCPEFVIVDEAHTCVLAAPGRGRHQRHELVAGLAAGPARHLVLVTATPHSGKEDAFRELLALLDPAFRDLPEDLGGRAGEPHRRRLARHLVQRRRADIEHYLDEETPFPKRLQAEATYGLSSEYRRFLGEVIAWARERVREPGSGEHRKRVRWWSALALLRSVASSPRAAAETLRNRAAVADTETPEEADALGRRAVFDDSPDSLDEALDVAPGARSEEAASRPGDARLRAMARQAEALEGKPDAKLAVALEQVREFVDGGFHPIVFCRYIPTAEYVGEHLRRVLPKGTEVAVVTGRLPAEEREARIAELGREREEGRRIVLVCTDCLSEGINLQEHFDAVLHYDLAWNPTRHEQREGRVDRFGQRRREVRVLTLYGRDNPVDGIVLEVLLRKHETIRSSLGISVPVPLDTNRVMEAILEGLLLRDERGETAQQLLPGIEDYLARQTRELHTAWEVAADREKRSRTLFAQGTIRPEEVARELEAARRASGSAAEVRAFAVEALSAMGAGVRPLRGDDATLEVDLAPAPAALRDLVPGLPAKLRLSSRMPPPDGAELLARTHPLVSALAEYLIDTALDPEREGPAARAGAIRTAAVARRAYLFLCRFRFDLVTRRRAGRTRQEAGQVAEEFGVLAFEGLPGEGEPLPPEATEALLRAEPTSNLLPEQARSALSRALEVLPELEPQLEAAARDRARELLAAHERVRSAARLSNLEYAVHPHLPVDLLGVYALLPDPGAGRSRPR